MLKGETRPVTIRSLSERIGSSPTIVYRLVQSLKRYGIIEDVGTTIAKVSLVRDYRLMDERRLRTIIDV